MCGYFLLLISASMIHYGIHHWPEDSKNNNQIIIDAEWEEINPNENKIDIYV